MEHYPQNFGFDDDEVHVGKLSCPSLSFASLVFPLFPLLSVPSFPILHYPSKLIQTAHCLQTLLHIVQCRADVSLLTYEWKPHYRKPWPRFDVVHECRDWDAVAEWAEVHAVDTKGKILVNPEMGKWQFRGAGMGITWAIG